VREIIAEGYKRGTPVAGVIVEPIQGEGGDNQASPEFFRELQQICLEVFSLQFSSSVSCSVHQNVTLRFCRSSSVYSILWPRDQIAQHVLCDVSPLMDELRCRRAKFIANALDSDSDVVSYVARYGVYFGRILLPDWPKCTFLLLKIWCFVI